MAGVWLLGVFALLCVSSVWARPSSSVPDLRGFRVLQLSSEDKKTFTDAINDINGRYNLDFWIRRATYAEVMVGPAEFDDVVSRVLNAGLKTSVTVSDVQKLLDKDFEDRLGTQSDGPIDVAEEYLSYDQINDFLSRASATATAADVTMGTMGKSYEGRDVNYVTIQGKNSGGTGKEKYSIVIDAGIHAREWTAVSMALNIINKLAFNPDNDPEIADMLDMFDWVIAPAVNPDGYEYSRLGTQQRLWRKSRNLEYQDLASQGCSGIGVDLNRNFGYYWDPAAGGSTDPCSEVFSGPEAFSEPETSNIRDWLTPMKSKTRLYLNLHAYGEWMLYPYGAHPDMPREEEDLMIGAGEAFMQAANEHGRNYQVGNSAEVFYIAAGGADDYAKGGLGISLSYTPELSPDDRDAHGWKNGFVQPKERIREIVETTWPGFKAMARYVFGLYDYPAHPEK